MPVGVGANGMVDWNSAAAREFLNTPFGRSLSSSMSQPSVGLVNLGMGDFLSSAMSANPYGDVAPGGYSDSYGNNYDGNGLNHSTGTYDPQSDAARDQARDAGWI